MKLDLASTAFLAQLAGMGAKPLHELSAPEARLVGGAISKLYPPGPEMASVRQASVTSEDGGVFDVRILTPIAAPRAVIVYYHGGGWVLGDIDQYDTLGRQLAKRTGAAVVMVAYRRAPEHRYPAAANDAWAALNWVKANLESITGRPA